MPHFNASAFQACQSHFELQKAYLMPDTEIVVNRQLAGDTTCDTEERFAGKGCH